VQRPSGEYAEEGHPVAGRFKQLKALDGTAPGDRDKAAKAMFEAVTGEGDAGKVIKGDAGKVIKGDAGKAIKGDAGKVIKGDAGKVIKGEGLLRVIVGPDCWRRVDEKVNVLRKTADVSKGFATSTNVDA